LETNDCNLDNTFCRIQKGKSEITKGRRKGQKNPLSADTEGRQKSVQQREHSRGHTSLRSQREGHIRIWKAKLEKHTHILGRAKGELSGHRKEGN